MITDIEKYTEVPNCTYYKNALGQAHRLDGPAVEWDENASNPGYKVWFVNDELIGCNDIYSAGVLRTRYFQDNEQFIKFMKLKVFW